MSAKARKCTNARTAGFWQAIPALDENEELGESFGGLISTGYWAGVLIQRYWLVAVSLLVSLIAAWAAAFELWEFRAEGGSILPMLAWATVWLVAAVLLGSRLIGLIRTHDQGPGLKAILEAVPIGIALYDTEGTLVHRNETFRQAIPDPDALRDADGDIELGGGRWARVQRFHLAGGMSLVSAVDRTREIELQRAKRDEAIRFQQFLAAAAAWTWETDILHRFSAIQPLDGGPHDADLEGMIGRSVVELAEDDTGANGWEAINCLRKMDDRGRLKDIRLTLRIAENLQQVRLSGIPRCGEDGAFLGYRGVGSWEKAVSPAPETHARPDWSAATIFPAGPLLLVDDSDTNRRLAMSMLNRMGYEVDAVDGGQKAIEAVRARNYAAVLMDIWMPEMDGFEATAAIRALPPPQGEIPVIAMTAHAGEEERRHCLSAGMNEHIGKPIDRAILASVLRKFAGPPPGPDVGNGTEHGKAPLRDAAELVNDEVLEQLRKDAGPALVNELIGAYMTETDERLVRIEAALKAGNLEEIGADAHSLKSSSGTFGALPLQALAARLEAAAIRGDLTAIARAQKEMPELLSETWAAFATHGIRRE